MVLWLVFKIILFQKELQDYQDLRGQGVEGVFNRAKYLFVSRTR